MGAPLEAMESHVVQMLRATPFIKAGMVTRYDVALALQSESWETASTVCAVLSKLAL